MNGREIMFPRAMMVAAMVALLSGNGEVQAGIEFVDAAAGDYRINIVSDVWLDGIEYSATFIHNISGDEWLLEDEGGPTITGHQDAMRVAVALNNVIATENIDASGGTKFTRNAYLPYTAAQPFPAAAYSTVASQSPLQYELGSSSLLVRAIGKYPEWAVVSFSPQATEGPSGDFNLNGVVDAADYTVWRDGVDTTYTQADYEVWKTNFGPTADSAPSADTNAAVPEPATLALLVAACLCSRRFRRFQIKSFFSVRC